MEDKNTDNWIVAALYRFVALEDLPKIQKRIKDVCDANDICGTLLIAPEGINGTIAGQGNAIPTIIEILDEIAGVRDGELKYSSAAERPVKADSYEKGVSCPHCIDKMTEERARSFRMRHEQMKQAGEEIPGDNKSKQSA